MKKIDNTNTYPNDKDMNEIIATLEDIDSINSNEYDEIFKHMDLLGKEESTTNRNHLLQVTSILQSHLNRINPCMNNSVNENELEQSVDKDEEPVMEQVDDNESEEENDTDDIWKEVEPSHGILDMIDEISNIVTIRKYKDNTELTDELTKNMQSLKSFVEELHKLYS